MMVAMIIREAETPAKKPSALFSLIALSSRLSSLPLPASHFPLPAPSLLVVLFLRRGDLAVHTVERARSTDEDAGYREHPVATESSIKPLSGEQEDDDGERELDPQAGEIGAVETLFRGRLRPLFVIHSGMKLTACEDFHKRKSRPFPKRDRTPERVASSTVTRS